MNIDNKGISLYYRPKPVNVRKSNILWFNKKKEIAINGKIRAFLSSLAIPSHRSSDHPFHPNMCFVLKAYRLEPYWHHFARQWETTECHITLNTFLSSYLIPEFVKKYRPNPTSLETNLIRYALLNTSHDHYHYIYYHNSLLIVNLTDQALEPRIKSILFA